MYIIRKKNQIILPIAERFKRKSFVILNSLSAVTVAIISVFLWLQIEPTNIKRVVKSNYSIYSQFSLNLLDFAKKGDDLFTKLDKIDSDSVNNFRDFSSGLNNLIDKIPLEKNKLTTAAQPKVIEHKNILLNGFEFQSKLVSSYKSNLQFFECMVSTLGRFNSTWQEFGENLDKLTFVDSNNILDPKSSENFLKIALSLDKSIGYLDLFENCFFENFVQFKTTLFDNDILTTKLQFTQLSTGFKDLSAASLDPVNKEKELVAIIDKITAINLPNIPFIQPKFKTDYIIKPIASFSPGSPALSLSLETITTETNKILSK